MSDSYIKEYNKKKKKECFRIAKKYPHMTKIQIAKMLSVSSSTVCIWLNEEKFKSYL